MFKFPDKYNIIVTCVIIALLIMFWFLWVYMVIESFKGKEYQIKDESVAISFPQPCKAFVIEGNSYVSIISPIYIKPIVHATLIDKLIMCESGGRHYYKNGEIIRGKAGEYGIAQYMPDSWIYFNKLRGTDMDIMSKDDQIDMLRWCIDNGLQEHWTCYNIIKGRNK